MHRSIPRSLGKAQHPARKDLTRNSEPKQAKSVPGFEPGLPGQNATALPLEPPPQPDEFCT